MYSQEAKGGVAKSEGARANEQQFAIFLLRTRLVVVRELGLLGEGDLCSVCLIVESQGGVCISEIVVSFVLFPILLCNPVQELCAILGIARNPFDTFPGPGHGVSFHPGQLGRCRQTDTL